MLLLCEFQRWFRSDVGVECDVAGALRSDAKGNFGTQILHDGVIVLHPSAAPTTTAQCKYSIEKMVLSQSVGLSREEPNSIHRTGNDEDKMRKRFRCLCPYHEAMLRTWLRDGSHTCH